MQYDYFTMWCNKFAACKAWRDLNTHTHTAVAWFADTPFGGRLPLFLPLIVIKGCLCSKVQRLCAVKHFG